MLTYAPKDCLITGKNSLSKCWFCRRRIPKDIMRTTFIYRDSDWVKHNNICADCLIKMVKSIPKKQREKIKLWGRITFLKLFSEG